MRERAPHRPLAMAGVALDLRHPQRQQQPVQVPAGRGRQAEHAPGLGLLRTKITRTVDPANPINGMEFQRSPHVTASGSVSWRPVDRLTLSANVRYHSRYFSTDSNSSALMIGDNAVAHARIDWRVGPTTLFGYVRNVFDTFYMTHLTNTTFGTAVEPRKIGIGVEAIF